jgi:hypothetical protein
MRHRQTPVHLKEAPAMHRLLVCLSAAAALAVPATAVAKSAPPAPIPAPGVAPAAKGGGKFSASLPADLPSDVTLPAGKLTGSTASSPNWSVGLLVDGGYADVMTSVHDFYVAQGYSDAGASWMYQLTNGVYDITFVGRNHDHSATQTDITIQVTKR